MIVYELYFVKWSISRYFNFNSILVDTLNRNYVVGGIFQIAKAAMRSGGEKRQTKKQQQFSVVLSSYTSSNYTG